MICRSPIVIGSTVALVLILAASPSAWACAVCFGNAESPLTQGAQKGVVTMLIITYFAIVSTLGMVGFTVFRARRRLKQSSAPCP